MFALLLTGCIENNLGNTNKDQGVFDTSSTTPPPDDTGTVPPVEECNGVDDNGDGVVDEGFNDVDNDGAADCVDETCKSVAPGPRSDLNPDCEGEGGGTPPANPWSVTIEWQHLGNGVASTPAVGDLDGDGFPEVAFDDGTGTVVVDGRDGITKWTATGMDPYSGPSIGDVDADGDADLITTSGECYQPHTVHAFDGPTATELWSTPISGACETFANLTDLDGDGNVEVIVNEYVLDGATGAVEFVLEITTPDENWGAPAVADMDQDGDLEILLANQLFDTDGSLLWTCGTGGVGTFPQPVNADSDDEGEVLVAGLGQMTLCDDDGTELWSRTYGNYGSAVAVADFDDDGVQEYAFANTNFLFLIEPDGTDRWVTSINDASGLAGCTSWDVNYDGVPEVIYADEQDIMVVDGVTGAIVVRDPNHGSWTASETPAVADVDGDGHGELVYSSNVLPYEGVTVIGSADGDWPYSLPVYNQYTYSGNNIDPDDLSIPAYTEAPWMTEYNLFRGQPSAVYVAAQANARVSITDVCVASCDADGRVDLWVQVWNDGGGELGAVDLGLYGVIDGVETWIQTQSVGPVASEASVEVQLTTTIDTMGSGFIVRVDEPDYRFECDESDNEDRWLDRPCPY